MTALEQLSWHYENRLAQAKQAAAKGALVAGVTSNTVPWELLRAAGFFPVLLSPPPGPALFAERYMEDVFDARIRGIFHGLASGEWPFLKVAVVPRTSEQEHKLYLYLREVARQGLAAACPRVFLYNLLHTRTEESHAYGLARTRELLGQLELVAGSKVTHATLCDAIEEGNRARRALARLLKLRDETRISGSEALPLTGAYYFLDRGGFAGLLEEATAELSARPALEGPRLLLKGAPLDHPALHRAIESQGAVVAAEDDWWGSRSLTPEISTDGDLVENVYRVYYSGTPSPRSFPAANADRWFLEAAGHVHGVVFYLPPEDDIIGWDYPRLRDWLDARRIPQLLIRSDARELSAEEHQRIAEFVSGIGRTR